MQLTDIKFHGNPFGVNRAGTCGRTDVTKLTDAFRNCVKAPENGHISELKYENFTLEILF